MGESSNGLRGQTKCARMVTRDEKFDAFVEDVLKAIAESVGLPEDVLKRPIPEAPHGRK